jgi:hypothetical protein
LIAQFVRNADAAGLDTSCLEKLPAPSFFEPIEFAPPAQPAVPK